MIELRSFQKQAVERIINAYNDKKKTALLIMPVGSGKTILSAVALLSLLKINKIKKCLYIADRKIIKSAFEEILASYDKNWQSNISVLTYRTAFDLIKKKDLEQFDVVVFDDVHDIDEKRQIIVYNYFIGFKIGLTINKEMPLFKLFTHKSEEVTFEYNFEDAIVDGYYDPKNNVTNTLLNSVENEINKIEEIKEGTGFDKEKILDLISVIQKNNNENYEVFELLLSGEVAISDLKELSHKKKQLEEFQKLLNDKEYFTIASNKLNGDESVWQYFFESNPWIFGFGLNYIFNSALEGKKLEQTVAGFSVKGNGKRVDALLHTSGLIQSLCFVEIKTHKKEILKDIKSPYRSESYSISDELAGSIAQIQRTIQVSLNNITDSLRIRDDSGFEKKSQLFLYKPKSYLIIGSHKEFMNEDDDIHKDKFSSFELFRRSLNDIDIITFDELYARADAMVNKKWNNT